MDRFAPAPSWHLFKSDRTPGRTPFDRSWLEDDEAAKGGIRCPRCFWRPSPSSVWCCEWQGTPEPYFVSCGTLWNTFSTRGRCPGCHHQWRWTSCPCCLECSPHEEWYAEDEAD